MWDRSDSETPGEMLVMTLSWQVRGPHLDAGWLAGYDDSST